MDPLLACLWRIYAAEERPGGQEVAAALASSVALPDSPAKAAPLDLGPMVGLLTGGNWDHLAGRLPNLHWRHSGLNEGRITPSTARHLLTCEVLGPTGMIYHPSVKVGLFYQSAHVTYATRVHAAEETFFILGGSALWTAQGRPPLRLGTGSVIHHPSGHPHATVTDHEPLLAAWRWTGDISFDSYALVG